ncbi:mannose-P-dolichol utilization defect 1 protein-like isoform X1 [Ruditapes philippinarum]|uniref:mannose-P-dolichol utilization defect 1 protein-like isoform X1 n=1 Tax=Ruditapes philippinarum TaxID=129788 RepID=UPI00295AFE08|nr:mannose-P-dolichol utilization defect 1 protein-like isoform X1 [Ruditapes philippinarum]
MTSFLDMEISTSSRLMTSPCFNEFSDIIKRKEITYGPCMLSVFSKTLGYVLIGTMTVSLIPQIVKILRKRSASGVSFVSILLTLEASSATVAYAIQKRFPVSAWGENIVLMHMNVVLICLLLRYNNKLKTSITFLAIYILFMLLLLWPTVPSQLVWGLYLLSMPAIAASRLIQMYKNRKTKDPGQLSATTAFLCIFQGFGRLTTSIVTTGDDVMIYTFAVVTLLNILLFLQVMYYRRKLKKVS